MLPASVVSDDRMSPGLSDDLLGPRAAFVEL
jgi:hypothetical protein